MLSPMIVADGDVQEPWAGECHLGDRVTGEGTQFRGDAVGELTGIGARRLCERQGGVGLEIGVFGSVDQRVDVGEFRANSGDGRFDVGSDLIVQRRDLVAGQLAPPWFR